MGIYGDLLVPVLSRTVYCFFVKSFRYKASIIEGFWYCFSSTKDLSGNIGGNIVFYSARYVALVYLVF